MDRGQRAVVIVAMLGEAFEALTADADVEQVICRTLVQGLQADVALCFVPDGNGGRLLTSHPDRAAGAELLGSLAGLDPEAARQVPVLLKDRAQGDVLVAVPPLLDPGDTGMQPRALAFGRREGFSDQQVLLLREAIAPLTALLPHAVAATQRRERNRAGRDAAREFGLTSRELEVLELLAQGLLATSIASRLSLSPRTVHKHLGNIYDKLGVHDRLVAVSLARGRGLVAA